MSDNVRSLHGSQPMTPTVDENVVRVFEELLERARAGQIVGAYVFGVAPDGVVNVRNTGVCCSTGLIGELSIAQTHLSQIILMDEE